MMDWSVGGTPGTSAVSPDVKNINGVYYLLPLDRLIIMNDFVCLWILCIYIYIFFF